MDIMLLKYGKKMTNISKGATFLPPQKALVVCYIQ